MTLGSGRAVRAQDAVTGPVGGSAGQTSPLMQTPKTVVTYDQVMEKPWRLTVYNSEARWINEIRCETFHELLLALGEAWAELMPEPLVTSTRGST